jgi:group II intron reverse transcriptase/maturase
MNLFNETKTIPISKEQVWSAWKKVKSNAGSYGVDEISIDEIKPAKHLYKVWNRLASGSYFPPAVREKGIPKADGKIRYLGIPTVCDRVAQLVIREELEQILEPQFSKNSFAYRPNKSAHDALEQCKLNCQRFKWAIDLDIKGFFDNIDWGLMIRALRHFTKTEYHIMYVKRWLKAPVQKENGELQQRTKGTPQGGVISPLLANLFLHVTFDKWFETNFPALTYERYADDIIVHCHSEKQANYVLDMIRKRMTECKLELHPEKTKIIYCQRNYKDKLPYKPEHVSFDFLGFTFRPRKVKTPRGKFITGFRPGLSKKSQKKICQVLREMKLHRIVGTTINKLGFINNLNLKIRGWINYYGVYRLSDLRAVFRVLNNRLLKWVKNKYKRFRNQTAKARQWLRNVQLKFPYLFEHWKFNWKM